MNIARPTLTAGLAALTVTAATVGAAAPATANDADVIRRGSCSASTDWKIKASPENGRIEVESEIDSNRNGQSWSWKLLHEGDPSASGSATTRAPSGSFEVRRVVANLAGRDALKFRATQPGTGEVCVARVTF